MSSEPLELTIGRVLRWGTLVSSACLAVGLLLTLAGEDIPFSRLLLEAGVIALLVTPVLRVLVSVVEYVREQDWLFVVLTMIVLAALGGSVVAALYF